jgi:tetratricopeptide (TPR) repeat protein
MPLNLKIIFLCLLLTGCGEIDDSTKAPIEPSDPNTMIQMAIDKQRIGAYDEAVDILRQALELDAQFVPAYIRMGLIYDEADQRKEAIESFNKVLTMEPENLQARVGLGNVYSKMTRNDLAVAEFLKAEPLQPNDTEILFKIALEYWYHQKNQEAAEYYQKVLAINPNHMQAHLNLISVYEELKDWKNAIKEIEISKRLGKEKNDDQAIAIAERKKAFIKGRMNLTDEDYLRKTQPPFE